MNKFTKIYFLFLLFLLIFFTSGVVDSQDGLTYLGVARNIYYKGEPTAPIYEYDTRENIHLSTYVGKNGKTYATTGLGYSIAYLPSVFITDLVYKFYNISPPVHFPLESDWLFLLLASFTNAFFGALLGVTTYKYLKLLNLDHKKSLILSLIGIFSTNLWIYTKHSFAHMMFVTFLLLSFYFLKKYSLEKKRKLLLFSGIFYGIVIITYNFSFTLTIIPYFSYYLILNNFKIGNFQLAKRAKDLIHIFIGMLPSLIIFFWFENLRSRPTTEQTLTLINSFKNLVWGIPKSLFFEGVFGQLFSPGKSIFLFSPITLLPIIFWHKYKKLNPESITFISLSLLYIIAHALHYKYGGLTRGYRTFWYGESSWGPRYLLPIVPFGIIIFGHIINNIKRKELMWVFIPIISIGFYVNLLGIIFPYQIKTHNNESKFYVNSNEFTVYDYVNIIPRYSPLISMTKNLVKLPSNFIHTINNGNYNVKFYDGIDFAFNVGPERWRSIEKDGYISFDNK
ncbi:MAG: hypothetical protein JW866_07375, partial [Ignavibacteriales bacterium]|nr:hypothetical protein [Ignavibacteriales bacterium]